MSIWVVQTHKILIPTPSQWTENDAVEIMSIGQSDAASTITHAACSMFRIMIIIFQGRAQNLLGSMPEKMKILYGH